MAGFGELLKSIAPRLGNAPANVSFRLDATTGASRLVRGPQKKPGPVDYLMRGARAFSFKWAAISIALTVVVFVMINVAGIDTAYYETALNNQAREGDWSGGLHSLFVLRMVASPRPFEFLVMIVMAPVIWHTLPSGWRFLIFPIIAQMLYMLLSQVAVIPLEFALLKLFSAVIEALRAFTNF